MIMNLKTNNFTADDNITHSVAGATSVTRGVTVRPVTHNATELRLQQRGECCYDAYRMAEMHHMKRLR